MILQDFGFFYRRRLQTEMFHDNCQEQHFDEETQMKQNFSVLGMTLKSVRLE